jgi:hypothetical protein
MSEFKEVVSNWFKANKIGDYMEGTFVSSQVRTGTTPDGKPQTQIVYEILTDEGKFHNLVKKNGVKVVDEENPVVIEKGEYYQYAKGSIDAAMKKIKIGQKVKFLFDSTMPSKNKMNNDFKLVKVYAGEMDKEYLASTYNEVQTDTEELTPEEAEAKDPSFT